MIILPLYLNLLSAALLRLKDKNGKCAEESQFVKAACLPSKDFPEGSECSISGWGATSECKLDKIKKIKKTFEKEYNIGLTELTVSLSLLYSTVRLHSIAGC